MWLCLVLCLLYAIQPLPALDAHQTSYAHGKAPAGRPASLDDCVRMAGGPQSRWKPVFGVCLTLFAKTAGFQTASGSGPGSADPQQFPPEIRPAADTRARGDAPWVGSEDRAAARRPQSEDRPGQKLVVATDARYRDVDAGVTSVYAQQQRRSGRGVRGTQPGGDYAAGVADESDDDNDNDSISYNDDVDDDGGENAKPDGAVGVLGGQSSEKRVGKRNYASRSSWPSEFRSALYRSRRQHSLSINSALVSLADMLMAKDRARERARHRAFHQQLLNLGR